MHREFLFQKQLYQQQQSSQHYPCIPRAWLEEGSYNFSFSGLKSAVINTLHNASQKGQEIAPEDLSASFQNSVIDVLVTKTARAAKEYIFLCRARRFGDQDIDHTILETGRQIFRSNLLPFLGCIMKRIDHRRLQSAKAEVVRAFFEPCARNARIMLR